MIYYSNIWDDDGGHLLLLDRSLWSYWGGVDAVLSVPPEVTNCVDDCELSGEVDEYAGSISVGPGTGVILNDENLPTYWFAEPKLLVRVSRIPDITGLSDVVPDDLEGVAFDVGNPVCFKVHTKATLFYTVYSGQEVISSIADSLELDLPAGEYTLFTGVYQPGKKVRLVLHQFRQAHPLNR
ncbi:hypothetical protein JYT15_01120 [Acidimicrobium ferrooxidans]|nr:hypothetical protein [Acidimicrobium ferrooxidans]